MIAAILAMGGVVLYGSNRTTAQQIAARIANAERLRAELIGEIELTLVPEPTTRPALTRSFPDFCLRGSEPRA